MPPKTRNAGWKCKICSNPKTNKDPGIECDMCNEYVGLECTNYTQDVYTYLVDNNVDFNFLCQPCKASIPELRSLLEITQQQQHFKGELAAHNTRISKCEADTEDIEQMKEDVNNMKTRLSDLEAKLIDQKAVETIAEKCFKTTEFPPLKIAEFTRNQEKTQKQLEETINLQSKGFEEVKRREDNQKNLIIYGIPENHKEDRTEQMKADYETLQSLYTHKVKIDRKDLIQISRVGPHKVNQIRPIRITLVEMQKRSEILRNNKNLKIYNEEHTCSLEFCEDEDDHHKHIYVSTDKTKQQRDEETKLRTELNRRRETENDLIIRNGKIVKKSANYARWSQMVQDGW